MLEGSAKRPRNPGVEETLAPLMELTGYGELAKLVRAAKRAQPLAEFNII